jgi:DNA-binding transcriptional MerR regulator
MQAAVYDSKYHKPDTMSDDFKTIGEVATQLALPQHVLRFWETQFAQVRPLQRRGRRRFYSQKDVEILERIKNLLYVNSYTIKGAKKALNQSFIPNDDSEMRKKKDDRQIDIFEAISKPTVDEKQGLQKILEMLKEIEKLLQSS